MRKALECAKIPETHDLIKYLMFSGGFLGVCHRDLVDYMFEQKRRLSKQPHKESRAKLCGICRKLLHEQDAEAFSKLNDGIVIKLECNDGFHGDCIRGWSMVGKRAMCPHCGEKSTILDELARENPWAKANQEWIEFLTYFRVAFVFIPAQIWLFKLAVLAWMGASLNISLNGFDLS